MRKIVLVLGPILAVSLLSGCATRIYGVPEQQWAAMGPEERSEAIKGWTAVQQAREERLRQEALLARQREAAQKAQRELCEEVVAEQAKPERPTRPTLAARPPFATPATPAAPPSAAEAAVPERPTRPTLTARPPSAAPATPAAPPSAAEAAVPEKIQVSLSGGQIYIANRYRDFEPVSFTLAEGQTSRIVLLAPPNNRTQLRVAFENGQLHLDLGPGNRTDGATTLSWDRDLGDGRVRSVDTAGPLRLRDVQLRVTQ